MDKPFLYLALIISVIMVLICAYFFWQRRSRSLGLWCLGGTLLVIEFFLDICFNLLTKYEITSFFYFIHCFLLIAGGFLILLGTRAFLKRPVQKWESYIYLPSVLIIALSAHDYQNQVFNLIINLYEGFGLIVGGSLLLYYRSSMRTLQCFTGVMLMIWGFVPIVGFFEQPYTIVYTWISPWPYLVNAVFGALTCMGFLFLDFQQQVHDEQSQNMMMRYLSHDLKTQAMVISNYSRSVIDGVYPDGSLENSIKMINDEAQELEKRVLDLLYLSKLEYLNKEKRQWLTFELAELIIVSVKKYKCRRIELSWEIDIRPLLIMGNREQWGVVLDNILDNQTRFAAGRVAISLHCSPETGVLLRIWNDGPPIEPCIMDRLFHEYQTGQEGQFGLGLVIVKKIIEMHQSKIWLANEDNGVAYRLEIWKDLLW